MFLILDAESLSSPDRVKIDILHSGHLEPLLLDFLHVT